MLALSEKLLSSHDEREILDCLLEVAGNFFRLGRRTMLQQDAEFVSTEARDRVAAAQAGRQKTADRLEEAVPGFVAAQYRSRA